MTLADMTVGQLRVLCQRCNCEHCPYWFPVPSEKKKGAKVCVIKHPRDIVMPFDDRNVEMHRLVSLCLVESSQYPKCGGLDCWDCILYDVMVAWNRLADDGIPDAWQRILEDERKLMETLLEVKP